MSDKEGDIKSEKAELAGSSLSAVLEHRPQSLVLQRRLSFLHREIVMATFKKKKSGDGSSCLGSF